MKQPDEFKDQVAKLGLRHWDIRPCSMCNYMMAYIFDLNGNVMMDTGCDCLRRPPTISVVSWDDVARSYNLQTNEDVIKLMDEFWQWDSADIITNK